MVYQDDVGSLMGLWRVLTVGASGVVSADGESVGWIDCDY